MRYCSINNLSSGRYCLAMLIAVALILATAPGVLYAQSPEPRPPEPPLEADERALLTAPSE